MNIRSLIVAATLTLAMVPAGRAPEAPQSWFTDATAASGLTFIHFNGMSGELYYPEIMPPGVALFDYDNDGDLDVFVVQGRMLGSKAIDRAWVPSPGGSPLGGRLFRNDLDKLDDLDDLHRAIDGTHAPGRPKRAPREGGVHFTDVTESSGIRANGYGMGVATGDYNNDGCIDLYVTNLGSNQLFRNNCNGTFTDVTAASHTASVGWSVSAAFVDFDRDGWLDLFVGHYVNYSVEANVKCVGLAGGSDYCPPHVYKAQPSKLYRNNHDGTFTDVTAHANLSTEFGPALGVATADFNGDGWPDIYVANDGQPNQLWINQRNGTFKNTALLAGAALGSDGEAKSSMGVDAGDFDNDGDEDLFITELTGQGADLYVNAGGGVFDERSARAGLRQPTLPFTGFGAAWLDIDNDGWLDLVMVNGAVTQNADAVARRERFALSQRKQAFRNLGNGRFEDVTNRAGPAFARAEVSRGAAFGDIDNDGDIDVVVGNASGPLLLLLNAIGQRRHWIGLRLVGRDGRRDMLGARVAVTRSDGQTLWRRARSDGSYASANDPRVLAGLGDANGPVTARVIWPDGRTETWSGLASDRYVTIREGTGR
jgi:enediyne biosynthesis protein E4